MDPMSAATAFATIISLLADFVAHRGAAEGKSFDRKLPLIVDSWS